MINHTRFATIAPGQLKPAIDWATQAIGIVRSVTGVDYRLALGISGVPTGRLVWFHTYDSYADGMAASAAALGDERYFELLASSGDLFLPDSMQDSHRTIVHHAGGAPEGTQFFTAMRGQVASGRGADALAWGSEIAEYTSNLVGTPITFFAEQFGRYGEVTWIDMLSAAEQLDDLHAKIASDAGYGERIDRAGAEGLFVEGSGHRELWRVLA